MKRNSLLRILRKKFKLLLPKLNERDRRLAVGAEAKALGHGGIALVFEATKIARTTIVRGMKELEEQWVKGRARSIGGGRKPLSVKQPGLIKTLKKLANPKGNPESPFLHTTESMDHLADEMQKRGYSISSMSAYRILKNEGFALKANKKNIEGGKHPDRNAQFEHIEKQSNEFQMLNVPILSCDCKKRELIGNFKNSGQEWQPKGQDTHVNVYDFESQSEGHAYPYGVYDILQNTGFINVGISHNTAAFAVASIRRWCLLFGQKLYPSAREIYILADGGNPNSSVSYLWKYQLQNLANETGYMITVSHYPPGTSKWNAIEHHLFSYISINWRAKPIISLEFMLELLNHTVTKKGLTVTAVEDDHFYETGIQISKEDYAKLNIVEDRFHGNWNYTILPQSKVYLQV